MQAILMTETGSPEVLDLQDISKPTLEKPNQLLIRLHAAGVNPIDTKLRHRGTFYPTQMPAILGCDGAGVVEKIASEVSQFKPGDEVYYCFGGLGQTGTGNYAQYALVEEHYLALKPKTLSFAEAAAAPLVLITAWEALYDRGRLENGQKVLIHAGAGGVGHVAIQLSKIKGAEVCTTVSSPDKERLVRQLGADRPILYHQKDFVEEAIAWTQGKGVDLAFDTVGGKTFFDTIPAVKYCGDLVTLLEPDTSQGNLKLARKRNQRISMELMLTPMLEGLLEAQKYHSQILRQCAEWIDSGRLKIHLGQTFPLALASKAHKAIEMGSSTGKIALIIPQ
ncbi:MULTISPECIES: zinc-dependent alcohol dehydrogenase family protein [Spirulina sp. CCY15215]|uniref:zinc-dependent alcohol dehydrogenase family protein n=1 Tax=Spirulina sp. CCY15215 TaxID=2767591 RepID=UPI0019523B14|nr:zinc-dependent alcohol dehydrogenase family protein [Spirulina major]